MADQPTVAVLGTGTMGAPMARNLAGAGLPVRVWNRSKEKADPLSDAGAHVAGSPAEAVEGATVVLTMLFDAEAVVETMESAAGALGPDVVWVQASTVGLTGEQRLKALADELGVTYVDAPVLGTKQPAEKGALVVLAAGPPTVRDRVQPVFDAVGQRTLWVSEEGGAATRLKLVANAFVLTVLEGVAQSLSMAESLGLDPGSSSRLSRVARWTPRTSSSRAPPCSTAGSTPRSRWPAPTRTPASSRRPCAPTAWTPLSCRHPGSPVALDRRRQRRSRHGSDLPGALTPDTRRRRVLTESR